ncbi:hypothetical protein [Sporomusa malonica]|uniref:Flagellar assembly protein T, N-terminal domain n=1 Tax=Sporomusa malonica TaxID=112901 RepID=A0A1W2E6Q8_9FIRM|nr:hypothetical protein [Sporomusa malonica]SMD05444.1 hypothetical protein SAMN04488500_12155 [Sporomusa malonica]
MKKLAVGILLISLILICFTGGVLAREVTVTGYGATRSDAISDALRQAIEQAVGTLVESETLVSNMAVIKDEIYARARGFVQNYDIINEHWSNSQVIITAKVIVDTAPNSELMSQLQRLKLIEVGIRDPRIAVIIPEYHNASPISDPAAEAAIIQRLLAAGFTRVIDANQIRGIRYSSDVKSIASGNAKAVAVVVANLDVDYLIIGEAFSQYVGNIQDSGILSSRARVEARLFKTDNGEIIATNNSQAGGVDITELMSAKKALNNAGNLMGNYMVQQLLNFASNPEKGVQLIIAGFTNYSQVNTLEKQLRQITGIKNVYIRNYSNGTATIDINYTGATKTLATELENMRDIRVNITSISNSVIQGKIIANE